MPTRRKRRRRISAMDQICKYSFYMALLCCLIKLAHTSIASSSEPVAIDTFSDKQCDEPPKIPNAKIELTNKTRAVDSRFEIKCKDGFRVSDPQNVLWHCRQDGKWANHKNILESVNTLPKCESVKCKRPLKPHEGLRIIGRPDLYYEVSRILIWQCLTNKQKHATKCQPNGEWSRPPPDCPHPSEMSCHDFGRLINGSHNGTAPYGPNTIIAFECMPNYELNGPPKIRCLIQGEWNDNPPTCRPIPAAPPSPSKAMKHISIAIVIVLIILAFICSVLLVFMYRWRQRQLQRKKWQRYFGYYTHRQSKTIITSSSAASNGTASCSGSVTSATSRDLLPPKPPVPVTDL